MKFVYLHYRATTWREYGYALRAYERALNYYRTLPVVKRIWRAA